ncbi:HAD family hydrolase [Natrarchaeobius chitinivorans]|uniref:HAD family hydrolase n=1 Tax=Natrarchaeobius chitinivorans TaxID=1679083 RepID=A0A3N6M3Y1_NATCH|nr:HAD-IA family hydrolase [Natrarchaeobius chitinivorans]RQG96667.1 HAD family hydrolase [Natrarchaeobius chitinivorans]
MDTRYDAVIFDNDGVLTTPTDRDVLLKAIGEAFANVGVTEPPADHVRTLVSPDPDSVRHIADYHGVDPEGLWHARERAAIEAQLAELEAGRKGVYDDVSSLEALSVPTAIVSNNQHETIRNILERCDLEGFEVWYGREPSIEGIERKKPTPHYLERAIDDLGATNPLYVGDSRVDVLAADAAGVHSAFIRRKHRVGYDLPADPEPHYEIDSLEGLPELV